MRPVVTAFRYAALCAAVTLIPFASPTAAGASTEPKPFVEKWALSTPNKLAKAKGTETIRPAKGKKLAWHFTGKVWDLDPGSKCAVMRFHTSYGAPKFKPGPSKSIKKCGKGYKKFDFTFVGVATVAPRICQIGKHSTRPVNCSPTVSGS